MSWTSRIAAAVLVGLGFGALAGVIDAEMRGQFETLTHEELIAELESGMLSPAANYAAGVAALLVLVAAVELLAWVLRVVARALFSGRRDEAAWAEVMAE